MKNRVKLFGFSILTAMYCLAVSAVLPPPISAGYAHHQTTGQEQYLAVNPYSLFGHTAQTESPANSFVNNFPVPDFRKLFDKHGLVSRSIERLFASTLTQYGRFSEIFLIQPQKSDLIFPFHYFW